MKMLEQEFHRFLEERKWLKNVTPKTLTWYEEAFKLLTKLVPDLREPADLTKPTLNTFVVKMRERGLCPETCNTRIKAINVLVGWLHAEGHLPAKFHLSPLRTEKRLLPILSPDHLKQLVRFKPKFVRQWRPYVLALLLVDTGLRIDEALGLRSGDVDFDNLLLKVYGKGRKERMVPFSVELRKILYRWKQLSQREGWQGDWVFVSRQGTRLVQRNALRGHYYLLARVGIPKSGFHRLRHTFATNYLQNGGDVVRLSRILGHAQLSTTMRYVHLLTADLQLPHQQLSILNRLR
jgi:integrase/recombinase XerD